MAVYDGDTIQEGAREHNADSHEMDTEKGKEQAEVAKAIVVEDNVVQNSTGTGVFGRKLVDSYISTPHGNVNYKLVAADNDATDITAIWGESKDPKQRSDVETFSKSPFRISAELDTKISQQELITVTKNRLAFKDALIRRKQ